MGWQGWIPRFIKNHGSLILTVLGGVGLIGTVAVTAKQAPKAEMAMGLALDTKIDAACDKMMQADELPDGCEDHPMAIRNWCEWNTRLTFGEKLRIAGPFYLPVILLGLGTLGCMAGAQILNTKQQAALIGAYALLQQDFAGYRNEIRDMYGEEADKKALAESRKKNELLEAEIKRLEAIKGVETFGISTLPGVIFRSDMANIERAFLHYNRNLALRGWADLEELYSFLGLPVEGLRIASRAPDENYGWNEYENEVKYGCPWLDYRLVNITTRDGETVYMIDFVIPPYRIDGADYDEEGSMEYYDGYLPNEAMSMLRKGVEQVPFLIDSASHTVGAPSCS